VLAGPHPETQIAVPAKNFGFLDQSITNSLSLRGRELLTVNAINRRVTRRLAVPAVSGPIEALGTNNYLLVSSAKLGCCSPDRTASSVGLRKAGDTHKPVAGCQRVKARAGLPREPPLVSVLDTERLQWDLALGTAEAGAKERGAARQRLSDGRSGYGGNALTVYALSDGVVVWIAP